MKRPSLAYTTNDSSTHTGSYTGRYIGSYVAILNREKVTKFTSNEWLIMRSGIHISVMVVQFYNLRRKT